MAAPWWPGSNSYGKGTVQTVTRMPNQGELTLTWARFHAPSGYTIHHLGVLPSICTGTGDENAEAILAALSAGRIKPLPIARRNATKPDDQEALADLTRRLPRPPVRRGCGRAGRRRGWSPIAVSMPRRQAGAAGNLASAPGAYTAAPIPEATIAAACPPGRRRQARAAARRRA